MWIVIALVVALFCQLFLNLIDSKWSQLVERYLECEKKREERRDSWLKYIFGGNLCQVPEYSEVSNSLEIIFYIKIHFR
jgi:hypothetical protein